MGERGHSSTRLQKGVFRRLLMGVAWRGFDRCFSVQEFDLVRFFWWIFFAGLFFDYPSGCPSGSGRLFFMQRCLLNFFAAVRKEGEPLEWNFLITTKTADVWTEKSMLIHRGDPAAWICLIEAQAFCSFKAKCATGFFSAHRTISPRKAAWNIEREAKALVADVRIEFAERQREQRQ